MVVYGVIELFFGISGRMDGVAHFAHVGGMLWGFLLLYYWETQRGDPLLIDEQGVLRRLQTRCFPETSEKLPGSVFNGVMLILSVATGAAMIVTLLAPFVHPGRTWIFPVLGLVAPAVYVITLLVTLYWIIRWRWRIALPLVVLLLAGLFKVPLFLKPELRRHYGEETSFGRGAITLLTFNVRSFL